MTKKIKKETHEIMRPDKKIKGFKKKCTNKYEITRAKWKMSMNKRIEIPKETTKATNFGSAVSKKKKAKQYYFKDKI